MNHRLWRGATGLLVAAMLLFVTVQSVAAYTVFNDPWKTWSAGGYAHNITVCEQDGYGVPGGTGGQFAIQIHEVVDVINSTDASWGGNLHYSWSAQLCSNSGLVSGQPYVAYEYGISCGSNGEVACESTLASGSPARAYQAAVDFPGSAPVPCPSGSTDCNGYWVSDTTPLIGYYDLYTIALHEMLHASTLGHTQSGNCHAHSPGVGWDSDPVMCPIIVTGERRVMEADDNNGLDYWY